jgi:tetratricopeptide (TPR) repeat protein
MVESAAMSSERFRRKDLKHDEFVTTTSEITRWLMERRRRIGWGVLAIVVLISILAMVQVYQQRQETSASALLAVAMEVYQTPLAEEPAAAAETLTAATDNGSDEAAAEPAAADATEGATEGSGETPDPAVDAAPDTPDAAPDAATSTAPADEHSAIGHRHFTTEAARYEAAREEFAPIVRRYGNTPSGRVASFYLGLCESSLGNEEAAAEALQQAAGASQEIIATVSLYRLGQLQMAEGQLEEAIASFDLLLARNSDAFPADEALMSKARAQEAAGDQSGAMLTYQRVVDDHPDSFSAADARTHVEELAVALGLDPDVERL